MDDVALSHKLWYSLTYDEVIKGLKYADADEKIYIEDDDIVSFKAQELQNEIDRKA